MERWATILFRLLWVLLVVFLVPTGFTIYALASAFRQLYLRGSVIPFAPSVILGLISLFFACLALYMLAQVALWKIEAVIHRWDSLFDQAESFKRQLSIIDRSTS